ncbi:tail fiber, partial [bacteria symbiont BFo1 of Frankliniella occidentalis]
STGNRSFNTLWGTANTTVDTNNFIKRASPIARLTNDVSQMQPDFAVDEQHIVAGLVSVNAEAEGVSAEKSAVGVYLVKGAVGLADEGWTLEVPQDINGNRLCFVELDTDKEGVITVSVFKRRFDVGSAMIVAGEPMDIPEGRWIDLRLQMPEDSVWNTRMREMEQAAEGEQ